MLPYFRFRFQRQMRRLRRDLLVWRHWLRLYFDRHVWGKWQQLGIVRRFVMGWWLVLVIMLIGVWGQLSGLTQYILEPRPVSGGSYIEGTVGAIKALNPLFPESTASSDTNRLIFSGLTRITPKREVEGDLATHWSVSSDGKTYTFFLRHDVKWHDGDDFNAQDVLYTLSMIQNPDARSPLSTSWQGIRVEAKDDYTVSFTLPNPYAPFIYSTTVGMLPSHLLGGTDPNSLRIIEFNQRPIGTGPFRLTRFAAADKEVLLAAHNRYHFGRPLLDQFTVRLYDDEAELQEAYAKHQLTAMSRLTSAGRSELGALRSYAMNLPEEVGLFWHSGGGLMADKAIRQAFGMVIDRNELISRGTESQATSLTLPLLPGQLGYSTKSRPAGYDPSGAERALDAAGWRRPDPKQLRTKDGQELKFRLVTARVGAYPKVATIIQEQFAKIGVKVEVTLADTTNLQQSYIRPRNYDALLYGINVGADPDVYAFWHSSQVADPGLNLSQYSSAAADKALETARLSTDPNVRAVRYSNFLATWVADVPAVILYAPNYTYVTSPNVNGVKAKKLVEPADRFYGIEDWTVKVKQVER